MTVDKAIYNTAHDFPGGARALAEEINSRLNVIQPWKVMWSISMKLEK